MLAIFSAETKSRFMSRMTFRAFQRNWGSGPKFHTQKTTTKFSTNSLDISYAKDMFLNCVCSRFACAYQTCYLEEICRESKGGGASWMRNLQVKKVRERNVLVQKVGGRAKRPGPKNQGGETSWSKMSGGGETSRSKMSGGETSCPKSQGVKRPSPKRRSPKSPGAKTFLSLHFMIVKLPL